MVDSGRAVEKIMRTYDWNNDDEIGMFEFMFVHGKRHSFDQFRSLDINQDGLLQKNEIDKGYIPRGPYFPRH